MTVAANRRAPGRPIVAPVFVRAGVPGKACVKCLEWRSLEKFAKHESAAGGRRNTCTTCEGRMAYANHREKKIAAVRKYQASHPEKHREHQRAGNRRRHGRKMAGGGVSVAEYRELREMYGGICAYCPNTADTMDHVTPLSRGGLHHVDNLVPACRSCNYEKHASTLAEWRERQSRS